jgi:hypothetical protein
MFERLLLNDAGGNSALIAAGTEEKKAAAFAFLVKSIKKRLAALRLI